MLVLHGIDVDGPQSEFVCWLDRFGLGWLSKYNLWPPEWAAGPLGRR